MANVELFCKRCKKKTPHLDIPEGKIYICSEFGCGEEIRTDKKGETMAYHKLDERKIAEMLSKWAALPEDQKNASSIENLAAEFGVSKATVMRKVKGSSGGKRKAGGKKSATKKAPKAPADPGAGLFQAAVGGIVDEKLAAFRAELPAIIESALSKLIKG